MKLTATYRVLVALWKVASGKYYLFFALDLSNSLLQYTLILEVQRFYLYIFKCGDVKYSLHYFHSRIHYELEKKLAVSRPV
jgi:hypothetical protein